MGGYATSSIQQIVWEDVPGSLMAFVPRAIDDMTLAHHLGIRNTTLWWAVLNKDKLYRVYRVPKRTPGTGSRQIQEPDGRLKYIQKQLLTRFLQPLPLGAHVGAYVTGRSIVHTARQHVKKAVIVSLDLKDFFPSIKRSMIRNYLTGLGYSKKVSSLMTALMTYQNFAPQGAPTSGTLANLVADKLLDQLVLEKLQDAGWTYTRYSDDIDMSSTVEQSEEGIDRAIKTVTRAAQKAGFTIKDDKTRVMRHEKRQKVLGLIVNDKVSIDPHKFKHLSKLIHACKTRGFDSQTPLGAAPTACAIKQLCTYISGTLAYFHQVEPERTMKLRKEFEIAIQNSIGFIHNSQSGRST